MTTATLTAKEKLALLFENKNFKDNIELRSEGKNALEKLQSPDRKTEDWKYSPVSFITKNNYKVYEKELDEKLFHHLVISNDHHQALFGNGIFLMKEDEGELCSVRKKDISLVSDISKNIFTALNAAHFTCGNFLHVPANTIKKETIHFIHLSTDNHYNVIRHQIHVEKNSSAEIILSFYSAGEQSFSNVVTEIVCEENASVKLHLLQMEGKNAAQYNHVYCRQQNNSRFEINTFSQGGDWIRNDLDIIVNGENCETHLNGLYLPKGKQHIDNHTLVDHKKPNCFSSEMYKGVMSENSTGVFNGKVFVRPDAQKINAYQQNANILLSDEATINSKPELEIYADDVKCSHGSTTGQLDEEAMFYLRSRGVGEENAGKLLVHAFVNEVIGKNSNKEIREFLYHKTGLEE